MFQQGSITVDDRFARFGGKSYAINKINSVEVRGNTKKGSTAYALWWIFTAVLVLYAISQANMVPFALAIITGFAGLMSWPHRNSVTTYKLFLVTSSSEAQAFQTTDRDEIGRLRNAIEDAMARS